MLELQKGTYVQANLHKIRLIHTNPGEYCEKGTFCMRYGLGNPWYNRSIFRYCFLNSVCLAGFISDTQSVPFKN